MFSILACSDSWHCYVMSCIPNVTTYNVLNTCPNFRSGRNINNE